MTLRLLAPIFAAAALAACGRAASPEAGGGLPAPEPKAPAAAMDVPAPPPTPQRGPQVTMEAISDTAITSRIKGAILGDPSMAGADVSVNTDKGVVSLTGTVRSQEQMAVASAHAQRQDGVLRVDNHLSPVTR